MSATFKKDLDAVRAAARAKHESYTPSSGPVEGEPPSYGALLAAWFFVGVFGGHHFLLGRYVHGCVRRGAARARAARGGRTP
jgi:hypothetical protein